MKEYISFNSLTDHQKKILIEYALKFGSLAIKMIEELILERNKFK